MTDTRLSRDNARMSTREIDARVSTFVSELESLIRKAALEAVQAALGGATPVKAAAPAPKAPKAKKPAAPAAAAAPAGPAAAKAAPSSSALPRVKKGTRRSPEDVAAAARAIKAHLASNPGQGVEAIAKALGAPSKDLALPILNLLGAKSIRKEGEKRGTRYFVSGSASEGKPAIAPEAPKAAAPAPAPKKDDKAAKGKKAGKKK